MVSFDSPQPSRFSARSHTKLNAFAETTGKTMASVSKEIAQTDGLDRSVATISVATVLIATGIGALFAAIGSKKPLTQELAYECLDLLLRKLYELKEQGK